MSELDETIREGLSEATDGAGEIEPSELAERLRARRGVDIGDGSTPSPSRTRNRWLTAAAMIVLLGGVAGFVAWSTSRDNGTDIIATKPAPTKSGFDGWKPGWHEIDPGPVPANSSMAWFDDRLIVAGTGFAEPGTDPSVAPNSGVWAFDPVDRQWSTLPTPPFEAVSLAAAGDQLVAVGGSVGRFNTQPIDMTMRWATWEPQDSAWIERGEVPVAPQLKSVGTTGPYGPNSAESLVWTGERVIDLTRGAVLDPSTGDSTTLPMPDDLGKYTHLIQATPVWTGNELVLVSWTQSPGLAWDAFGSRLRDIPGPPMADANASYDASGFVLDGRVVLVARSDEDVPSETGAERAASYDPVSGEWTLLPPMPQATESWCPYTGATVGDDLFVQACHEPAEPGGSSLFDPLVLHDNEWGQIPRPPRSEQGIETWLGTDGALIVWSGDNDTLNNPDAPYMWAAVWIPDDDFDPVESVTTTSTDSPTPTATSTETTAPVITAPPTTVAAECTVDELPDLGPALPALLDTGPDPGMGGTGDSEGCFRHWGSSRDQGTHLTQYPGSSLFGNVSETTEGRYAWFDIEDGFAVEYRGPEPWAVNAYGISREKFYKFVQALLADPERYGAGGP